MKYRIAGYGMREPFHIGVEMAQSDNEGYALDIARSLAYKYPGQIFGVIRISDNFQIWRGFYPSIQEV